MEKLYLRLESPLPNIDHVNAIDHEQFADVHRMVDDRAAALGVSRFNDFYVYNGEYGNDSPRWFSASDGLATMRALTSHFEANPNDLPGGQYEMVMAALNTLADVLDDADMRDIRFCLVGDY